MNHQSAGDDPDRTELLATRSHGAVPADTEDALKPGARLGRYRIESLLGRGGMGEVYRAEQLEPVRRTVALKLLRARRLDARHLARFEVERQLLAQMRHPAIAQVYDADTTSDGDPFFAMEFIAGSPLTAFCESHSLPLRQRIELFIRICEGVQHAHQKGVIHRDLKPGNLLVDDVDGRALPRIIDFGIATASARVDGREVAGTPDYMSPEQCGGDQSLVDTRSDVYSLGVVLYELLTGMRPVAAGETLTAESRTLRLPSRQLDTLPPGEAEQVARRQGLSRTEMRRTLRHELDWVVDKALRHVRGERYASASALADDLQRYLDGRPLLAVPSTRAYVWRKFARRHRAGLVAAGIALFALLGGLGISVYGLLEAREQRAIAERRSGELEKVAAFQQSMLQGVDIEAMGLGLADELRRQVRQAAPDDSAALEQALGHASTTDIARGLIDRNILSNADAAIARDFTAEPGLAANLRESVAAVREALGLHDAAAEGYARVAAYRATAFGAAAAATLDARQKQAAALLEAARPKEALELVTQALADADKGALSAADPRRLRLRMHEASAIAALGDRTRARGIFEALHVRAASALGEDDPVTMEVVNNLAILLGRMGDPKLGRRYLESLVPRRVAALGEEDAATLASQHNLAVMRAMTGDMEGAVVMQRTLAAIQTRRLGREHPQTLTERGNLATMLIDSGKPEEALPILLSVLEADTRVLGADHPQTLRAKLNLSTLYARLEQFERTLSLQQEVIDARTRLLGPQHPDTLYVLINRAGSLAQAGRPGESLSLVDRVLPLARRILGDGHPQTQAAMKIRADDALDLDRSALAIASYRTLLAAQHDALGDEDAKTIDTAWQLEGLLIGSGQSTEAGALRARYITPLLAAGAGTLTPQQARLVENIHSTERDEALAANPTGRSPPAGAGKTGVAKR